MTMTGTVKTQRRLRATKTVEPERLYTTAQVLDSIPGLSFRMLDYWLRTEAIRIAAGGAPGSGRPRMFSETEMQAVARLFHRYTAAQAEVMAVRSGKAWAQELRNGVADLAS